MERERENVAPDELDRQAWNLRLPREAASDLSGSVLRAVGTRGQDRG